MCAEAGGWGWGGSHSRGAAAADKVCLCSFNHSSAPSHIHEGWQRKGGALWPPPSAPGCKHVPASGPESSPACLLSVFAQAGLRAEQVDPNAAAG